MLGFEFISGWGILNVAGFLSTPKWLRDKCVASRLSSLAANYQVLYESANTFDRILARFFWFFYGVSVFLMLLFIGLNALGLFG